MFLVHRSSLKRRGAALVCLAVHGRSPCLASLPEGGSARSVDCSVPAETLSAVAQRSGKAEVQNQVAVEVPELPPFLLWRAHCLTEDGSLPVVVSNREDFRRSRGDDATRDSLRQLLDHGRPSPLYVRIFY